MNPNVHADVHEDGLQMIQIPRLSCKVFQFSCNVYSDIVDMNALGDHIVELSIMMESDLSWLKRDAQ